MLHSNIYAQLYGLRLTWLALKPLRRGAPTEQMGDGRCFDLPCNWYYLAIFTTI